MRHLWWRIYETLYLFLLGRLSSVQESGSFLLRERIQCLIICKWCCCIHSSGLSWCSMLCPHIAHSRAILICFTIILRILIRTRHVTSRSRQSRQLPYATILLHTVVGTTACNQNYRLQQSVVGCTRSSWNYRQANYRRSTKSGLRPQLVDRCLTVVCRSGLEGPTTHY